ncbi:MAG: acyltransferase [Nitrospinae bacterium]|nr:acyltransferase [Nitrospinota bacterium]
MSEPIDVQIQNQLGRGGRGKVAQYQDLIVGSRSWLFLAWFELVALVSARVPGGLGMKLRGLLYPTLLKACGADPGFAPDVWLRYPRRITLGEKVRVGRGVLLDAKGRETFIDLGDEVSLGEETVLSCKEGSLRIGARVTVGKRCNLSSNSLITLGDGAALGDEVCLFATMHTFDDLSVPIQEQGWTSKGIIVGAGARIGAGSSLLDGVTVGEGAVVLPGSVVTADVAAGAAVGGVPARPV